LSLAERVGYHTVGFLRASLAPLEDVVRVFILGIDGYLGWALAQYLGARGMDVGGCDALLRREWVEEVGSTSATPILPMSDRVVAYEETFGKPLAYSEGDLCDYAFVASCLESFKPDAIVHLGEMPSAPYSMIDVDHAVFTHTNNMIGTINTLFAMRDICPDAHLVKLGTMGEYGTPNIDIPEGFFEIEYRGRKDRLPFPRQAGSWYHQTKVHDTNNVMFACKIWGLRSTDIMQGVVFGTRIDEMGDDPRLCTRFDFDQAFGTAINRYCAQSVAGHPLTVFGSGNQKRGFLPLRDAMQCLTIAITKPPESGEYRVFNQFEEVYNVTDLAHKVKAVAEGFGLDVQISNIENPRKEAETHYYNPDRQNLIDLGYEPTRDMEGEIKVALKDLIANRDRIVAHSDALLPDIRWDGTRRKSAYLSKDA
jgi:UDP-sulfoquinovose synthase